MKNERLSQSLLFVVVVLFISLSPLTVLSQNREARTKKQLKATTQPAIVRIAKDQGRREQARQPLWLRETIARAQREAESAFSDFYTKHSIKEGEAFYTKRAYGAPKLTDIRASYRFIYYRYLKVSDVTLVASQLPSKLESLNNPVLKWTGQFAASAQYMSQYEYPYRDEDGGLQLDAYLEGRWSEWRQAGALFSITIALENDKLVVKSLGNIKTSPAEWYSHPSPEEIASEPIIPEQISRIVKGLPDKRSQDQVITAYVKFMGKKFGTCNDGTLCVRSRPPESRYEESYQIREASPAFNVLPNNDVQVRISSQSYRKLLISTGLLSGGGFANDVIRKAATKHGGYGDFDRGTPPIIKPFVISKSANGSWQATEDPFPGFSPGSCEGLPQ